MCALLSEVAPHKFLLVLTKNFDPVGNSSKVAVPLAEETALAPSLPLPPLPPLRRRHRQQQHGEPGKTGSGPNSGSVFTPFRTVSSVRCTSRRRVSMGAGGTINGRLLDIVGLSQVC